MVICEAVVCGAVSMYIINGRPNITEAINNFYYPFNFASFSFLYLLRGSQTSLNFNIMLNRQDYCLPKTKQCNPDLIPSQNFK